MTIEETTDRVYALGNAWEQFKQVNDARLNDIERKGHSDPLYDEHLLKISASLENDAAIVLLDAVGNDNAKGEFYLTDVVALAVADGVEVATSQPGSETEVAGVKLLAVAKPDGAVQLYSGAAIYAITPCTEEQARDRWPYMFGAAAELSPVTGFDAWVDDLDDPDIDDEIGDDE